MQQLTAQIRDPTGGNGQAHTAEWMPQNNPGPFQRDP